MEPKLTIADILALKNKRKITMLTAYDYPLASLIDRAGIDMVLVGDSVANVVLGLDSTTKVGMSEMLHHAKAVRRAVKNALVVGDMPFESYQLNPDEAVKNAKRFIDEAGCDCVKLEWFEKCLEVTEKIVRAGIPVMGHIGLTPQTADKLGGFKVQGKDAETGQRLIEQASALEKLGCFSVVLECVPDKLAEIITGKLTVQKKSPEEALWLMQKPLDNVEDFRDLPLTRKAAALASGFRAKLPDPFDQLIVASALDANLPLITKDQNMQKSGLIQTVW